MPKLIQSFHPGCFAAEFPGVERPPLKGKPQYAAGSKDFTFEGEQYSVLDTFVQPDPNSLLSPARRCSRCGKGFHVGERGLTVSWKPRPGSMPISRLVPKITFTREDGSVYDPDDEKE